MNFNALMGAVSILSAQFLPNFNPIEFNSSVLLIDSHNIVTDDDTTFVSLTYYNDFYSVNYDNSESNSISFDGSYENYYSIDNLVGSIGFVPSEIEIMLNCSIPYIVSLDYFAYDIYLNSYDDELLDIEVISDTFIPSDGYNSIYFILDNFDYYYNNYTNLYFTYNFSMFFNDSNTLDYTSFSFGLIFESFDGYLNDLSGGVNTDSFYDYLLSRYYYNLGLENGGGTPPDATMYDLIYDFISNNLLRSEQDTGGLARILTDTSMVLIFITLIMLLVFVFKWCSHNILGG